MNDSPRPSDRAHRSGRRLVRFRELTWADINCDLQVHTTRTDGQADLATVLDTAAARGIARIAITEHVRRETDWFPDFAGEVRAQQGRRPGLEVLVGCETKGMDTRGTLDATEAILAACDLVLGSVHRMPDGHGAYVDPGAHTPEAFLRMETDFALGMIERAPIDVLAHPCGMFLRKHKTFPAAALREILERGRDREVPVEINTSYLGGFFPQFLELCQEINPYVSVGSDAHKLDELGACRDRLRAHGVASP